MDLRHTYCPLAAVIALTASGAAHADALRPIQSRSIDLGTIAGNAYYTVEPNGFRLVATLAQGDTGTPVRFEALLLPGQSVVLSSPHEVGIAADAVEIVRRDDELLVNEPSVTN